MEKLIAFFSFSDPNVRNVVIGSILLTASSAAIGCFTFLRKRALVGDAVAHSVLPGVCLSFMISGTKNPFFILFGAFTTGWLSIFLMDLIKKKTRIKEDTAIGLILSVFFGIGILLLTSIQHSGNASQSGLDSFLFGKAAAMVESDLYIFGTVAIILLLIIFIFFKEFTLLSFDPVFAETIGLHTRMLEVLLTTLTVLAVVVGIQSVGVVLMAAMLITPAAAARFWTNKLSLMVFLAIGLSTLSGITGAYISYLAPSMPTGPWIVMIISFIAIVSFIFAPAKGVLSKWRLQKRNQSQMLEENILKLFFQMGEKEKNFYTERSLAEIFEKRKLPMEQLKKGLKKLLSDGYVTRAKTLWTLTEEGKIQGQRVTKLHRLWEMYLTEYLRIAPDHVHEDAESIEHIITPELERKLEEQLKYPKVDPHSSEIPYKNE